MLSAIVHDFARMAGVETVCLLSDRADISLPPKALQHFHNGAEAKAFQGLARDADYTLVIAPESRDILLERIHWVEKVGGRLLGSSPDAVELASDKLRLARYLREANIPVPETRLLHLSELPAGMAFPLVLKPRRGAGAQDTYLVSNLAELRMHQARICPSLLTAGREEGTERDLSFPPLAPPGRGDGGEGAHPDSDEMLLQPYIPGQPASVLFLVGAKGSIALLPAAQHLSVGEQFQYVGGSIPLRQDLVARAVTLAERVIRAVPGLAGYIGVDLILGEPADGSGDYVIEVNPRLTTSYIGLRALAKKNLAEALLSICVDGDIPDLTWRRSCVRFWTDGRVEMNLPEV